MEQTEPVEHTERIAAAVRMRTTGATYRAIGAELGVSPQTVMRWIKEAEKVADAAALAPVIAAVRDYRTESHGVLDAVVQANLNQAGTPGNGNLLIRAVEVRARMEGLIAAPVPQTTERQAWANAQVVLMDYNTGRQVDAMTREVIDPGSGHPVPYPDTFTRVITHDE